MADGFRSDHWQALHLPPKSEEILYLLAMPQPSLYLACDGILWNRGYRFFFSISGTSLSCTLFSTWKEWVSSCLVSACLTAIMLQDTVFSLFWLTGPIMHQPSLVLNAYGPSFILCSVSSSSRAFTQFAPISRPTGRLSAKFNWCVIWSKYSHCFNWDGYVISALSTGKSGFV